MKQAQFALNYSPEAAQLIREGQIEIDLFKCPDWEDLVQAAQSLRPVYIHFPISIGDGRLERLDFKQVENWLAKTETRFVNAHICPSSTIFGSGVDADFVIEALLKEIGLLGQHFGMDRIIIENVPYPDPGFNDALLIEAVQPAVIRALVVESGCGFLLDIAHALLACEGIGQQDVCQHLTDLPVASLRELHITGIGPDPHSGHLVDHLPLQESDWLMLNWVLGQIDQGLWRQPEIIACEYGGIGPLFEWRSEAAVLAEQIPLMREMIASTV
ncbi:hypothetical protein MASR2M15_12970 [Anaerolineales bacterium]